MFKFYRRYLVSYSFQDGLKTGNGSMFTTRRKPFSQQAILDLCEWIKENQGYDNVVIISISKLNRVYKRGE